MTAFRSSTNDVDHERPSTGVIASDRPIRWATTGAVLCVAIVAAVVSYRHAFALVRTYGEAGWTAGLVPLTVDGLIFASSMVLLHSARRKSPAPVLARCLHGLGITATLAANAAHGLDYRADRRNRRGLARLPARRRVAGQVMPRGPARRRGGGHLGMQCAGYRLANG